MYKNLLQLASIFLCCSLITSCNTNPKQTGKTTEPKVKENQLVGNDKDEHGCIASAGYQWSELLKDCIRPFEKGIRLSAVDESLQTFAAYLVFDADSSNIELFLPKEKLHAILSRTTNTIEEFTWTDKASPYQVKYSNGNYTLYKNHSPYFVSETIPLSDEK